MKNNKGFTLVELIGVFAILGIIMLVAVPNVMGILDRNKKNTYIQHAKQMATLAEYKISADPSFVWPTANNVAIFTLSCLGTQDIETGPNGSKYDSTQSFVAVYKSSSNVVYYINLIEKSTGSEGVGLNMIERSVLNSEDDIKNVTNFTSNYSLAKNRTIKINGSNFTISSLCS